MNTKTQTAANPYSDKAVLITGCSSGIGRCVAETLQARGYRVFASARKPEDVATLSNKGFDSLQLDLDDSDSIRSALDSILESTNGQLYALFNNGGYGQPGAVEDLRREVLRAQFETNFFGTAELTNRVLPVMRRQGFGRIITNSSVLGLVALPYRGAYNASKFALEGLSDTLRLELYDTDIHVSLIEPGPISSHFRENAYRAYQQNIDAKHSAHHTIYKAIEARLAAEDSNTPFTLPPSAVAKKVIHALESHNPKARYYVTFPTHLFGFIKRILSTAMQDKMLRAVSRSENLPAEKTGE